MFTGLIRTFGVITQVERRGHGLRLRLRIPRLAQRLRAGDSVAVDGVCLSVAARRNATVACDVIPETLRRTTLGRLRPGDRVHVESPLRAGDALHGHLLLGHVDGTARVIAAGRHGRDRWLDLTIPSSLRSYCIPKGNLGVHGVSLTIGAVRESRVRLYLIPMTLQQTTLGRLRPGDRVNLEADLLVKTAVHTLRRNDFYVKL